MKQDISRFVLSYEFFVDLIIIGFGSTQAWR